MNINAIPTVKMDGTTTSVAEYHGEVCIGYGHHYRPETMASTITAPKKSSVKTFNVVPRPMSTPARNVTANMSQFIVAARMVPRASAIMAASQSQRPAIRAVTTTTMIHRPTTNKKFRSKNASALSNSPTGISAAVSEATTDISTGYSNSAPAAKGANPRAPKSAAQSE